MRDYASLYQSLISDLNLASDISNYPITSDMGVGDVARLALARSFYKKLCPNGNSRKADEAALNKFKAINQRIKELPRDFEASNEAESCFYDYYRNNLRVALEPSYGDPEFDLEYIRGHMDVGPGAAQKADSRWAGSKLFESVISYSNEHLIALYRAALSETGFWAEAEMLRYQKYGFVKVDGGKIFFASKDAEISRTCCTEPSLEMLIQKAVGAFIEERNVRYFGINLSTQADLNGELARIGSIDGSFGTQDLVSASDSIGLRLIERDFPDGRLKGVLLGSRCKFAVLPDGTKVELSMISTMGNGFTFPLQTLIFACAVQACYQVMDFPCARAQNNFGVFGDDIIVRREAYYFVASMLAKLGFEVNLGKSFATGKFRESCGYDWYDGHHVRGIYVKSLETPQQVYSCFNRLTRWSSKHGVPLTRTLTQLMTWARDIRVPPSESDDAGFKVPFVLTKPKVNNAYWFSYRCYQRRVRRITVLDHGCESTRDHEFAHSNEFALACGFMKGIYRRPDNLSLTDDRVNPTRVNDWSVSVSLRDRVGARSRYQIVKRSLPWWDYLSPKTDNPPDEGSSWRYPLQEGVSQRAWEGALVALNLFEV